MLIRIKKCYETTSSEITPEHIYRSRRQFMADATKVIAGSLTASTALLGSNLAAQTGNEVLFRAPADLNLASKPDWLLQKVVSRKAAPNEGAFTTDETLTPFADVTTYNNFYEFGTGKSDPSSNARNFSIDPWKLSITGEVGKPGNYTLEDILAPHAMEERIYRLRCVEAWSMVIPWIGFPLADLIKRFEPNADAKFIQFQTLEDASQMPGVRSRFATIDWPYQEGLRMDEAMHPLTLLAVGLYDDILPAQNGAPLRLVVPWKYGFKSIKSIVSIDFRKTMPNTTWNDLQSNEYGFYANVNPTVSHPRWSQSTERRLPTGLFSASRIPTLPFNGYALEVADLYTGMDLQRYY